MFCSKVNSCIAVGDSSCQKWSLIGLEQNAVTHQTHRDSIEQQCSKKQTNKQNTHSKLFFKKTWQKFELQIVECGENLKFCELGCGPIKQALLWQSRGRHKDLWRQMISLRLHWLSHSWILVCSEWEEVFSRTETSSHCDGQCGRDPFCGVIDHVVLTCMWSMSGRLHSSTAATGLDGDESPLGCLDEGTDQCTVHDHVIPSASVPPAAHCLPSIRLSKDQVWSKYF